MLVRLADCGHPYPPSSKCQVTSTCGRRTRSAVPPAPPARAAGTPARAIPVSASPSPSPSRSAASGRDRSEDRPKPSAKHPQRRFHLLSEDARCAASSRGRTFSARSSSNKPRQLAGSPPASVPAHPLAAHQHPCPPAPQPQPPRNKANTHVSRESRTSADVSRHSHRAALPSRHPRNFPNTYNHDYSLYCADPDSSLALLTDLGFRPNVFARPSL